MKRRTRDVMLATTGAPSTQSKSGVPMQGVLPRRCGGLTRAGSTGSLTEAPLPDRPPATELCWRGPKPSPSGSAATTWVRSTFCWPSSATNEGGGPADREARGIRAHHGTPARRPVARAHSTPGSRTHRALGVPASSMTTPATPSSRPAAGHASTSLTPPAPVLHEDERRVHLRIRPDRSPPWATTGARSWSRCHGEDDASG
jgi:hypothetical protein